MAKDFKKIDNPAMQFITTEEETAKAETVNNTDNMSNMDNMGNMDNMSNTDSTPSSNLAGRCFNLVFSSTETLKELKALAFMEKTKSVNALINKIVAEYIAAHADDIRKYNDFFN